MAEQSFRIRILGMLQKKWLPCKTEDLDKKLQHHAECGNPSINTDNIRGLVTRAVYALNFRGRDTNQNVPVNQMDQQSGNPGRHIGEPYAKH